MGADACTVISTFEVLRLPCAARSFAKFGIPKFDDFAACVADPCNTLIEISNTINDVITDVQDTAALVSGAYRLQLETGAKDHDKVLVNFTKADGTYATGAEVRATQDTTYLSLAQTHSGCPLCLTY